VTVKLGSLVHGVKSTLTNVKGGLILYACKIFVSQ